MAKGAVGTKEKARRRVGRERGPCLKVINFPARKSDLLDRAKKTHVERAILEVVGAMTDQDYRSMADVMKCFGEAH